MRPDLAGAHLRQRVGRLVDHHLDLVGDQVLHGGAGAAIGHELVLRAGRGEEGERAEMGARADAGGAARDLVADWP